MPFAVSGCWRCVTTPATSTTLRASVSRSVAAVTTPRAVSSSRTNSVGCLPGAMPVAQRSAAVSSTSLMPGSVGASIPVTTPGSVVGLRVAQRARGPQPGAPVHAEARERAARSRATRARRPARRCAG